MRQSEAKAIAAGAELVKAPDWSETNRWYVVAADGALIASVVPYYRVLRRVGWSYYLACTGPMGQRGPYPNRITAGAAALETWIRVIGD